VVPSVGGCLQPVVAEVLKFEVGNLYSPETYYDYFVDEIG
jgi:hypothetical protein